MKIYHNPRCSKSRETLAIIEASGVEPEVILYMDKSIKQAELKRILTKLGMKASQLVRKSEKLYKENFKGESINESKWIKILSENPKLIERPIVVKGGKAIIGRPPETVQELL